MKSCAAPLIITTKGQVEPGHSEINHEKRNSEDYYSIKQSLEKANNGVLQVVNYRISPIVMLTDGVHM